jgi:hypothetical protein
VFLLIGVGALRVVGCGNEPPMPAECVQDEDCDDQNECTNDSCVASSRCSNSPIADGWDCDFDGTDECCAVEDGICVSGTCQENPCDDGNECTIDFPPSSDGSCDDPPPPTSCHGCYPCDWNGEPGVCAHDVCGEDPCEGVVCDDGDLCTDDVCSRYSSPPGCGFLSVRCPDDSNRCTDVGACEPDTGECVYESVPDGKSCDDDCNYCECANGVCTGCTPKPDGTECRFSTGIKECKYCECVNGVRTPTTSKPDGTPCSGGFFWACKDGQCSCEGGIFCGL